LDARQTAEAFAVLERALARYPESEELKSLLQVAHSRLAAERAERESAEQELRQRRAAIENEIVAARELLDARRTGDSITRLELALGRHPDSEELKGALAHARQRLAAEESAREKAKEDERRRRAWIDAEISATRQWIGDKHADRAVTSLQKALHQYPDNEELKTELEVAKRSLAIEQASEKRQNRRSDGNWLTSSERSLSAGSYSMPRRRIRPL
jgi:tetratricopeptide (TPR) repeat protein